MDPLPHGALLYLASGAAPAIAGLGTGEFFGFHILGISCTCTNNIPYSIHWRLKYFRANICTSSEDSESLSGYRNCAFAPGILS